MASSTCRVASMISGPMPSPRMTVIVWVIRVGSVQEDAGRGTRASEAGKSAAYYAGWRTSTPAGRASRRRPDTANTPRERPWGAAMGSGDDRDAPRPGSRPWPLPRAIPRSAAGRRLGRVAGQQRLELARTMQRHHVVVAADVGVADEDLRHGGATGQ